MQGWAVAVTPPQTEHQAAASLKDEGFELFFPRIKRKVRQRGKRVHRLDPLFPNYLFVFLSGAWQALFNHRYLSGVLMSGEHPAIVSTSAIQQIKAQCNGEGIYLPPPTPKFKSGDAVQIGAGQFYGFSGELAELLRNDRAIVSCAVGKVNVAVESLIAV